MRLFFCSDNSKWLLARRKNTHVYSRHLNYTKTDCFTSGIALWWWLGCFNTHWCSIASCFACVSLFILCCFCFPLCPWTHLFAGAYRFLFCRLEIGAKNWEGRYRSACRLLGGVDRCTCWSAGKHSADYRFLWGVQICDE